MNNFSHEFPCALSACVILYLQMKNNNSKKTLAAYKINAYSNMLEVVSMSHDFKEINELIGSNTFTVGKTLENGDTLYVDDEGFLNEGVTRGFLFDGSFFAGNGLVLGSDDEGESCSVKGKAVDTAMRISFAPEDFEITGKMRDDACEWTITGF